MVFKVPKEAKVATKKQKNNKEKKPEIKSPFFIPTVTERELNNYWLGRPEYKEKKKKKDELNPYLLKNYLQAKKLKEGYEGEVVVEDKSDNVATNLPEEEIDRQQKYDQDTDDEQDEEEEIPLARSKKSLVSLAGPVAEGMTDLLSFCLVTVYFAFDPPDDIIADVFNPANTVKIHKWFLKTQKTVRFDMRRDLRKEGNIVVGVLENYSGVDYFPDFEGEVIDKNDKRYSIPKTTLRGVLEELFSNSIYKFRLEFREQKLPIMIIRMGSGLYKNAFRLIRISNIMSQELYDALMKADNDDKKIKLVNAAYTEQAAYGAGSQFVRVDQLKPMFER